MKVINAYPAKTGCRGQGMRSNNGLGDEPFVTKRQPLNLLAVDRERLELLRRSRSEEKRRVLHAAILLDCANGMNDSAVAAALAVNRHSVT